MIYAPSRGTTLSALPQAIRSSSHGPFLLWLDDLEGFLGKDGLNPSLLDSLKRLGVAIVATMQDHLFETYANIQAPETNAEHDASRQIGNRLLRAVEPIRIGRLWSANEIARASAASDERLTDAVTHSAVYGVSEYLAAGPALLQSWLSAQRVNGNPRGAALVQASVDLARAGFRGAVDIDVLEELHTRYLPDPSLRPETWSEAVAWATKVRYGVSGLLVPGEYEGTWRAFDYLPDSASRNKKDHGEIPDFIWEESLHLCPDDDDLWRMGMGAYMEGRSQFAIAAWEPLAESGNGSAASNLAAIFSEMGDHEAARYWRYIESQDDFHSVTIPVDPSAPLYDNKSGEVTVGQSRDGERLRIAIHKPGLGVRHGVIAGGKAVGKSNSMTLVLLGALSSGKYVLWLMDWSPEQKHYEPLKGTGVVDWFVGNNTDSAVNMLSAAVRIIEFRKGKGGYIDPTAEKPAIVIGIEEAHRLFNQSSEAAMLCLQILHDGASAGVSIFLTLPDITLESFGGNAELRAEVITNDGHWKFFMGEGGLSMLRDAKRIEKGPSIDDPFD
ncbi:hypothetical protein [Streptomyces sp. NPDC048277]|uniref:hypothetical protein n=1 Tax=Streptomyces sp. NPDC048277 TaxID=3155027 RepID=UPI0033D2CA33